MSERAKQRVAVLRRLSDALGTDRRLTGAILDASGATGFRDDEDESEAFERGTAEYI